LTKFVKIKDNVSFCDYLNNFPQLENCTEAQIININGIDEYNCTKCNVNNTLYYNSDIDSNICRYIHYEKKCMVKYCKSCQNDNNYFCSECFPVDYEVNEITGSCVKKMEKVPAITWKDVFRLQLNQQKDINGQLIIGPSLILTGITNSQINTGHAFLIYLIFKLKNLRNNRNLEEEIKVPTICEIIDSVDETFNEVNMVEYECIGNSTEDTNLEEYTLGNIEEGNNTGFLVSNLDEVVSEIDLSDLENKENPSFKLTNLEKTIIFEMDEIQNQTSNNYNFDFTVSGTINKDLEKGTIEGSIELTEIKNKTADCQLSIKGNSKADLSCQLNVEDYKEYKTLTFKTSEIGNYNKIYLSKINEVFLINNLVGNDEDNMNGNESDEENNNKNSKIGNNEDNMNGDD
jgi:hypothetical protein